MHMHIVSAGYFFFSTFRLSQKMSIFSIWQPTDAYLQVLLVCFLFFVFFRVDCDSSKLLCNSKCAQLCRLSLSVDFPIRLPKIKLSQIHTNTWYGGSQWTLLKQKRKIILLLRRRRNRQWIWVRIFEWFYVYVQPLSGRPESMRAKKLAHWEEENSKGIYYVLFPKQHRLI